MHALLIKTWVPPKKRKLKSGKVIDVKGYYDPRAPKRGYMVANDNWVMASKDRDNWVIPASHPSFEFSGDDANAVREDAKLYALKTLRGEYLNHETKWPIHVTALGIKKILGHSANLNQCLAVPAIPEMLQHASFSKISKSSKEKHGEKDALFWSAHVPVVLRGRVFVAKLVIKYMHRKYVLYDYDLSKKVSAEDLNHGSGHKPGGNKNPALSISIGNMKKYVNSDGGVLKKSHSLLVVKS